MRNTDETPSRKFATLIKTARRAKPWTQDELVDASGVSRSTIIRWEKGDVRNPEPEQVRAVFVALGLDPREAPVALGFVTREEMGLPPEPAKTVGPEYQDVIDILTDPDVPDSEKREWLEYLRFRTGRATGRPARGQRRTA